MTTLFSFFQFKKPIIFKEAPDMHINEGDFNIVAYPNEIQIYYNSQNFNDEDPEMLASAKLGELDPLLITFFFKKILQKKKKHTPRLFRISVFL